MAVVRITAERLFLLLFWVTRSIFLAHGAAMCAALAAASVTSQDSPAWLGIALHSVVLVGATLFVTGILMVVMRRLPRPRADNDPQSSWSWLLGLSLVALPALANPAASALFSVWGDVSTRLDDIGFWPALQRADPHGGIVILPILVALFVPSLETVTAFFLIAVPPAMLVLLVTRSPFFPKIFAMLSVCQVGLVLAGVIGADAFSRLASEATAAMATAPDVEVHRLADELRGAQGVLVSTAEAFVVPMLGYLAWLPFLLWSRRASAFFKPDSAAAPS
jgi:hypothetical protein